MIYSKNLALIRDGSGYMVRVGGSDVDMLFEKYGGKVNIIIRRPQSAKTEQQMAAIHALITAYFVSGLHSYDVKNSDEMKIKIKFNYGVKWKMDEKTFILKSLADYTKMELADLITAVLSEINQAGAINDPKIQEIIAGMAENKELKT